MMRIVHYLNPFFGQIGSEEKTSVGPSVVEGAVGPGLLINTLLGEQGKVVASVICGDDYFAQNPHSTAQEIVKLLIKWRADVFIAGPAFNAGRYGLACARICRAVTESLAIPAVTGMSIDNPGVNSLRRHIFIIETAHSAVGMADAMTKMIGLAQKLAVGSRPGTPEEDGYIPHGFKENIITDRLASERAVDLLLIKMKGNRGVSEITFPELDLVPPAPPIAHLVDATIALVTEGGLVPTGNPDSIPGSRATTWGKYRIDELLELGCNKFSSVHRGFDTTFVNEDCNRLLPVDVLAEMEKTGIFARIYPFFFSTTGVATTIESAHRIGKAMASELAASGVTGVLVAATWGTGTRCGAVLEKEIERAGIPAVLVTALVPTAHTLHANRVIQGSAITHPFGDPKLPRTEERALRRKIVEQALEALAQTPQKNGVRWGPLY